MSRGFHDEDDEQELVTIDFVIEHQTEDAYLIGEGVWLPKSIVTDIDEAAGMASIPKSWAEDKGLGYE